MHRMPRWSISRIGRIMVSFPRRKTLLKFGKIYFFGITIQPSSHLWFNPKHENISQLLWSQSTPCAFRLVGILLVLHTWNHEFSTIVAPKNYTKTDTSQVHLKITEHRYFLQSWGSRSKNHRKTFQKSFKHGLKIVSKSSPGASWSSLGASWGILGAWTPSLGCFGAVLEPSWGRPGAALGRLGGLLGRPWGLLRRLGDVLGRRERIL